MIEGYYYLHTNGDLIYKRELDDGTVADLRESTFVRHFWPMDPQDRANAWRILVEASALDANPARIAQLAETWKCDDEDAEHYASHLGCRLYKGGDAWGVKRIDSMPSQEFSGEVPVGREDQYGFGDTVLAALADLARKLGFKASKMWGASFPDLLKAQKGV